MNSDTQSKTTFEDKFAGLGRKLDARFGSAFGNAEEELRKVIAYLNDEVVPHVRKDSTEALRMASQKLAWLAEYLERHSRGN